MQLQAGSEGDETAQTLPNATPPSHQPLLALVGVCKLPVLSGYVFVLSIGQIVASQPDRCPGRSPSHSRTRRSVDALGFDGGAGRPGFFTLSTVVRLCE